jgi:UDP-glucose 4-epimerase
LSERKTGSFKTVLNVSYLESDNIGAMGEGDQAVMVANSKKAKEVLGWKPEYADLEMIIKTAWEWRKKLG